LLGQRLLLAVGAVERVVVGEELLGIGLLNLPRRVAQHRVKARLAGREDIRELQLPVEESALLCHFSGQRKRGLIGLREIERQRRQVDLLAGPEPQRAPQVHAGLERMVVRVVQHLVAVHGGALVTVVHWQAVQRAEHLQQFVVHVAGFRRRAEVHAGR
jgi:hypothetical protein